MQTYFQLTADLQYSSTPMSEKNKTKKPHKEWGKKLFCFVSLTLLL